MVYSTLCRLFEVFTNKQNGIDLSLEVRKIITAATAEPVCNTLSTGNNLFQINCIAVS